MYFLLLMSTRVGCRSAKEVNRSEGEGGGGGGDVAGGWSERRGS